ncbi:MAG TPA: RES family NAD+ phosphorylase [Alphaproteobacteria bacterium]|nr:RES family NAD+ phosphorylase [Alphaproteobacteria bacterium]
MAVTASRFAGRRTHRLIASRYPTIGPFDYIKDAEAAAIAAELETATNDRLNDVAGRLALLDPKDIVVGIPTAHQVMAAFLHTAETGGRFNSPDLGAWYAALEIETAIAETLFHHGRRLGKSAAGFPNAIEMRELITRPRADLVDIRAEDDPGLYAPDDYRKSQAFGRECLKQRRDGIWYRSVRRAGGENVVIYKPRLLVPVIQGDHYRYDWDRQGNPNVARITGVQ